MPDVPWQVLALLLLAALVAGWVDAVVGGGGLVQLPALLLALPGATPVQVLATNKLSGVWGTSIAAVTYARKLPRRPRATGVLVLSAGAGSALGAALAALVPPGLFTPLVLVLVVVIGVVTVAKPQMGLLERHRVRNVSFGALLGRDRDRESASGTASSARDRDAVRVRAGGPGRLPVPPRDGLARIANAVTNLAALRCSPCRAPRCGPSGCSWAPSTCSAAGSGRGPPSPGGRRSSGWCSSSSSAGSRLRLAWDLLARAARTPEAVAGRRAGAPGRRPTTSGRARPRPAGHGRPDPRRGPRPSAARPRPRASAPARAATAVRQPQRQRGRRAGPSTGVPSSSVG